MDGQNLQENHTKVYLTVFGALALLTLLTVGASYLHLARPGAIALGAAIAAIKVSLIVAFFMHLKNENRIIHLIFFAALFLVFGLLLLVLPDIGF